MGKKEIKENSPLELFNEFYKFRTKLEFGTLKTFHMKFTYLDINGKVRQDKCQDAIKGGKTPEKIQMEIDKEKYFLERINDRRKYFDFYLRHASLALSNFNEYPTNLYMHYRRRAYMMEFKAAIKTVLSELAALKKEYPGVDLDAYEEDIKTAKHLLKMIDGLKPYDNKKLTEAEEDFFGKSDKQEVKNLFQVLKSDELPFTTLIQEETPL